MSLLTLPKFNSPEAPRQQFESVADVMDNRFNFELLSSVQLLDAALKAQASEEQKHVRLAGTWARNHDIVGSVVGLESDHADNQALIEASDGNTLGLKREPTAEETMDYLDAVSSDKTDNSDSNVIDIETARSTVSAVVQSVPPVVYGASDESQSIAA